MMGLYVEVMCDERKDWPDTPEYAGKINHRCWSNANNNPQGRTAKGARDAAREGGWLIKGNYACCPGCRKELP
jgi:hypothetical protein